MTLLARYFLGSRACPERVCAQNMHRWAAGVTTNTARFCFALFSIADITLHYIALHYITLHCIALYCIIFRDPGHDRSDRARARRDGGRGNLAGNCEPGSSLILIVATSLCHPSSLSLSSSRHIVVASSLRVLARGRLRSPTRRVAGGTARGGLTLALSVAAETRERRGPLALSPTTTFPAWPSRSPLFARREGINESLGLGPPTLFLLCLLFYSLPGHQREPRPRPPVPLPALSSFLLPARSST